MTNAHTLPPLNSLLLIVCFFLLSACNNAPQQLSQPVAEDKSKAEWDSALRMVRSRFPNVKQISTIELSNMLKATDGSKPILMDARAPEEYFVSHLQGARLAPDPERTADMLKDVPKDQPIVVYCSIGYRSSDIAERLQKAGFINVTNLEGSIFAWANEGRPVYKRETQVATVHPFNKEWGRLLKPELHAKLDR